MNNKKIVSLMLAISLMGSGVAFSKTVYGKQLNNGEEGSINVEQKENMARSSVRTGKVVNVNNNSNLRVREEASTSSRVLGHLYRDNKVTIKGEVNDWYNIDFKGANAYVHKDYITIDNGGNNHQVSNKKGQVINVNSNSNLRIRENASTNSSIVGHLYSGNTFNIRSKSGDWYNIEHNGKVGYVHKDYVKELSGNSQSSNPSGDKTESMSGRGKIINVNSNSNLRIRVNPNTSSSIVGYLYSGNTVNIKEKSGSWYKIEHNGKSGYIHGDYVQLLNNSNGESQSGNTSKPENSSKGYEAVFNAMKAQVGTPYVYGGGGELITKSSLSNLKKKYPSNASKGHYNLETKYIDNGHRAFDCSGLMQWGFRQAGINLGRSTYDQINSGKEVSTKSVKPGDLLFYGDLSHVGMYVGNDQWIESPRPGKNVRITNVPWNKVSRARRVL